MTTKIFDHELKKRGYSLTKNRQTIFKALSDSKQPLSISEIKNKLPGLDKVTIYRTIDLFIRVGFVKRIWQGLKSKYELADVFLPHHHHIVCLNCQKIESFSSPDLEESLKQHCRAKGFKLIDHDLELSGYCQDCKKEE